MDAETILRRADNVTFEVVADEAILIQLDKGTYFSLNEVGTEFWQMLDGRQTIAEHAAAIARKYNRKTADFIAELSDLAHTKEAGNIPERTQLLADKYNWDVAEVRTNLAKMGNSYVKQHAAQMLEAYTVATAVVVDDLLELVTEMATDELVEEVA